MTRRFFARLIVGITLSMPILAEYRQVEAMPAAQERPDPLSPLRRGWISLNERAMDKFNIGLQMEIMQRGITRII